MPRETAETAPIEPIVVEDPDSPLESRTKTAKLGHRIEVDLDDADALAEFLMALSKLVREKRRIVLIVE